MNNWEDMNFCITFPVWHNRHKQVHNQVKIVEKVVLCSEIDYHIWPKPTLKRLLHIFTHHLIHSVESWSVFFKPKSSEYLMRPK